ncbi:MAG: 16S rRNA (cytosine(1402)-N(4))-methyltransferase RsmH [Candidatus Aminicenantales bacterium]
MNHNGHTPVLLEESMNYLKIERKGTYIDCTLGLGGHAVEILKRNPEAKLIGFDIDEASLLKAKENLLPYRERVELFHSDFRYIPDLNLRFSEIRGVLLDLGVSSFQLDSPQRGFSYNINGPLDMRMDLRNKTTAYKVINKYSEHQLRRIFREYGEIRNTRRLVDEIIKRRKAKKIATTGELRQLVEKIFRWRPQKGKTHPAAKVFQALRIEVNQELKSLSNFLERLIHLVPHQTRIAAISFHSLEDRIIKHTFVRLSAPANGNRLLTVLTRRPVTPSPEEIALNFRARSAKLRVAEKV